MSQNYSLNSLLENVTRLQNNGKYQELIPNLDFLLKKDPKNAEYILWKLQALDALGVLTDNLALIQNYVDLRSSDATGFIMLYQAYMKQENYASAVISLVYALSIEPDNDELVITLLDLIRQVDNRYNRVKINIMTINRIGHLACEIEPLLRKSKGEQEDDCLYLFISPNANAANKYLYQLLESNAFIVEDEFFYRLYASRPLLLEDFFFAEYPYDNSLMLRGVNSADVNDKGYRSLVDIYKVFSSWLELPFSDITQCWTWLKQFNITSQDKIVCLHVRDNAYLNQSSPNLDFSYHDYRDMDILNYQASIEYLVSLDYKVIRIGGCSNQKLDLHHDSYLDLSQIKDDRLGDMIEIMLLSVCDFFIGCSSGPASVSAMFDTPTLAVNVTPFHPPWGKHSRFIPKRLFQNGNEIKMSEVYHGKTLSSNNERPLLLAFSGKDLVENNYSYQENTSDEILAAVKEFSSQIEGRKLIALPSDRQVKYSQNLPKNFLYKQCDTLVCDSFLVAYPELFE